MHLMCCRYPGKVARVVPNRVNVFDILYDDGDLEVSERSSTHLHVKSFSRLASSAAVLLLLRLLRLLLLLLLLPLLLRLLLLMIPLSRSLSAAALNCHRVRSGLSLITLFLPRPCLWLASHCWLPFFLCACVDSPTCLPHALGSKGSPAKRRRLRRPT